MCENTHHDVLDSVYILVLQFVISPYQLTLSAEAERHTGKCNRGGERERERKGGGTVVACSTAVIWLLHGSAARRPGERRRENEGVRERGERKGEPGRQLLQPDRKEREK